MSRFDDTIAESLKKAGNITSDPKSHRETWASIHTAGRRRRRRRRALMATATVIVAAVFTYCGIAVYQALTPESARVFVYDSHMVMEPSDVARFDSATEQSDEAAWIAAQLVDRFESSILRVVAATQGKENGNPVMGIELASQNSDKLFVHVVIYRSQGDSLPKDAIAGGKPSQEVSIPGTAEALLVKFPQDTAYQIVALLSDRTAINIISGKSLDLGADVSLPLDEEELVEAVEVLMGLVEGARPLDVGGD